MTALEKSTVDFECKLSVPVSPDKIQWFVAGQPISPDDTRFNVLTDGQNLKLTIPSVDTSDAGEVSVRVGEKETTAKVVVEGTTI